jgi:hypothetical protein
MKKLLFVLLFSAGSLCGYSQKISDIVITPGVGVNNIKLGMSEKRVTAILGEGASWSSYKEQLKVFSADGTRIDSVMQFVLGFDSCARYDTRLPDNMPVFALYFKAHKLNYITVTSYSASDEQLGAVKISNGLRFHTEMDLCEKKMGTDYVALGYGDYTGDHYYYKKGIEMVYDESKLTAIGIFPSTPGFKKMIAAKSEKLLKEAAAVKNEDEDN